MSHNFYPNLPVAGGMFANPNAGASSLSEGNSSPSNSGPPPTSASIVPQVDLDDLFKDYYFGLDGQIRLGGEGPGLVNQVGKPLDDAAPSHDAPGQENISYAPAPSSLLIGEQQTQKPPSEMQDLHRDKRGEIRERQQGKKKGKDDEDERQKIERRERNREHAKVRILFFFLYIFLSSSSLFFSFFLSFEFAPAPSRSPVLPPLTLH